MSRIFMVQIATGLYGCGIARQPLSIPVHENGTRRPDSPAIAQAAVGEAVAKARKLCRCVPLIACGESFGGLRASECLQGN
jgi:predicted alpha/beta-hydrolase family hydrolase